MKTIAEKIRDQRLALDLTQQELADRAGITNRTISIMKLALQSLAVSSSGDSVRFWVLQRSI